MGSLKNIGTTKDCYGCGVCEIACPQHIIEISLNENGFYEPLLTNPANCTDCGLCLNVCSYNHKELAQLRLPLSSYGVWSKNKNVRKQCSSGGVAYEISKLLIEDGNKVCAVRYNEEKGRAEHYIASTVEDLDLSKGSKYLQSYTLPGFKNINRKEKYLVVGTPCQIDSFRRYIQKFRCEENFILMDFFCHGVPSYLMWRKYIEKFGFEDVTEVRWRDKRAGWHDSWNMVLKGIRKETSSLKSKGDMFYKLFLSNLCLGKACYKSCKFKNTNSSADIRIGDFWGKTYRENEEGVSAVLVFTEKGNELLHRSNIQYQPHPVNVITEGQLKHNIKEPVLRIIVMRLLKKNIPIDHYTIRFLCTIMLFFKKIKVFDKILREVGIFGIVKKIIDKL